MRFNVRVCNVYTHTYIYVCLCAIIFRSLKNIIIHFWDRDTGTFYIRYTIVWHRKYSGRNRCGSECVYNKIYGRWFREISKNITYILCPVRQRTQWVVVITDFYFIFFSTYFTCAIAWDRRNRLHPKMCWTTGARKSYGTRELVFKCCSALFVRVNDFYVTARRIIRRIIIIYYV